MALQPATGMAVATLIVRSVTVTIRHNDSEATASDAATAFDNFEDATRTERSPKPEPAVCDRVMVVNPQSRGESPLLGMCQKSLSGLGRQRLICGENVTFAKSLKRHARNPRYPPTDLKSHASAVRSVSVPGTVPGAGISAGLQFMDTNRGSASTRFSQAFTEG